MANRVCVTIAPPGAGKTTWAARSGWPAGSVRGTQVINLDDIRAEICGDAADQTKKPGSRRDP